MHRFLSLAKRFGRDERGVFAVLFGLMAIVLVALSGAVVDYVALEQARNRSQVALDAAALALQPLIFEDPIDIADITAKAEALLHDRLGIVAGEPDEFGVVTRQPNEFGVDAEIDDVQVNIEEGSLTLEARMWMPTIFVSLVGVQELDARLRAEATRKKLELEVVMVLDNSGSMQNESRMTRLVEAAKCATYILMFDKVVDAPGNSNTCVPAVDAEQLEDVRVGIVPFTMFVNVGPGNANANWIDKTGASSIHFDNFDNDDDEDRLVLSSGSHTFPTRQTLAAASGESWRGCVEARPHTKTGSLPSEYLDTDDTLPVSGDTLFVPLFSPDTANNNYVSDNPAVCDRPSQTGSSCSFVERRTSSWWGWNTPTVTSSTPVGPINFTSSALYPDAFYGNLPPGCTCRSPSYTSWTGSSSVQTRTGSCTGSFVPTDLSAREYQERICKYYDGVSNSGFSRGPNADCTRTPILPLTDTPATVISTIENMQAEGGTNIHTGTVWGMRVLSPTEPFTQGGSYDEAISKVMIIMTDGENTAYQTGNINGSSYNSAYGFPYNSQNTNANSTSGGNVPRLGPANATNAQLVTQMNERTAQTCANAKEAGITVYTIGLATNTVTQSTPAVVQAMLTACATTADRARFPTLSSELKAVFEDIADDLSALRLAQ